MSGRFSSRLDQFIAPPIAEMPALSLVPALPVVSPGSILLPPELTAEFDTSAPAELTGDEVLEISSDVSYSPTLAPAAAK